MKKLYFLFCIVSIIAGYSFSSISAQSPYSLYLDKETTIFSSSLVLGIIDNELIKKKEPLSLHDLSGLSRKNINSFDRGATYNWSPSSSDWSDVLLAASILSPLILFTSEAVRDDIGTFSTMYLQNILTTYSVSHLPKGTITRYRPYVYNEDVPEQIKQKVDATHSFFSAHTSVSFASSVFLSCAFSKYNPDSNLNPYIWGTTLILATTVGYLRYASGEHFPTDIITGAVVGSAIGFLIPFLHKTVESNETLSPFKVSFNNLISIGFSF